MRNTATESQESDCILIKLLNIAEECIYVLFLSTFFLLNILICHSRRERKYFGRMLNYSLKENKERNSQIPSYYVLLLCSQSRTGRLHLSFKINFVVFYRLCSSVFIPAWSCLLQSKNLSKFLACGYPINYVAVLEGK